MSIEKLYNTLVDQDLLSIGFDEFQSKLQDDNYKSKVYGAIIDQDLYSGDFDTFNKQFPKSNFTRKDIKWDDELKTWVLITE